MANYKAGNLTLELFGVDRDAEKTITNVVNKLTLLHRSLNTFQKVNAAKVGQNLSASLHNIGKALGSINENDINKLSSLAKATNYLKGFLNVIQKSDSRQVYGKLNSLFRGLSSSINSIDQNALSNVTSVSTALSSLGRFSTKITKLDFSKTETGFKNLATAIQPFLEKVKEAEAGLSSLYGILQKSSGKKIRGLLGGGNRNGNGGGFGFAKRFFSIYALRRMGHFMGNLVQAGSDYNETLNLWQVAMRNNLDVADQFVNKMQKAYGISTKTLMNAQAVFKNMIGSLGQISDQTAYKLSEALVQMSADYASLYNRTLESAFQNMQSMLAGQVRPIRSAGLDMTETTLFMFYQQLGGTKTMRQLNRTEKQLLSILAVYKQMGSAGALGDMSKTLNQFANQSRMMTEYLAELKTWSGLLLKDLIDQSGMLVYINALLITATEVIKLIAKSRGIGEENYLTGLFETAEATNDEVDELQGKLLDFDKFRSLEGASTTPLAIDEKLLEAITGYSSKIDQAANAAEQLATEWLNFIGIFKDSNGEFTTTEANLENIKSILDFITANASVLLGLGIVLAIVSFGNAVHTNAIVPLLKLSGVVANFLNKIDNIIPAIHIVNMAIVLLAANIGLLIFGWDKMTAFERVIGIFGAIGAAALAAAAAIAVFHNSWTVGTATVAILGGLAAIIGVFSSLHATIGDLGKMNFFANGASDIDGGTLFVAGEMGKTEAVYTGGNGKTNVANVRQMEQAFYNALSRHSREGNGTIVVQAYLDGEKVYENTTSRAKSRGNVWAKA